MTASKKVVAKLIRNERDRRGWSRAHLAEQTGLAEGSIDHYEAGLRLPNQHALARFFRVFGVMFVVDVLGVLADAAERADLRRSGDLGDQQADGVAHELEG